MGLIEVASGESVWPGMDYYEEKKVLSWEEAGYEQSFREEHRCEFSGV